MDKAELAEQLWRRIEPTVFFSRDTFLANLEEWEVVARQIDGQVIGATLTRGPEFHFVTFAFKKAFPASLIVECLQPIIDAHGIVITKTPKEDIRQRRFNQLIGFHVDAEDEYYVYYSLKRLHLHKAKSCQQ